MTFTLPVWLADGETKNNLGYKPGTRRRAEKTAIDVCMNAGGVADTPCDRNPRSGGEDCSMNMTYKLAE